MIKFLLVTKHREPFSKFASTLEKHDDVELSWAESGQTALKMLGDSPVDLVVLDEELGDMTGVEFMKKLLSVNPMINCAAVSPLPHKEFHEITEGLGVLAQLPIQPDVQKAEDLLKNLNALKNILKSTS